MVLDYYDSCIRDELEYAFEEKGGAFEEWVDFFDYTSLNSTFTKFLDTFLTNDSYGELNNFDESERLEMLKESGMMVISLMGAKENQNLDQTLMLNKLTKDGIFAPVEDNKVCEHISIIGCFLQ